MGDWNARLIYPSSDLENTIMGKFTMHKDDSKIENLTDSMRENRELMVAFCAANEMIVTNTTYKTPQIIQIIPNATFTNKQNT